MYLQVLLLLLKEFDIMFVNPVGYAPVTDTKCFLVDKAQYPTVLGRALICQSIVCLNYMMLREVKQTA